MSITYINNTLLARLSNGDGYIRCQIWGGGEQSGKNWGLILRLFENFRFHVNQDPGKLGV